MIEVGISPANYSCHGSKTGTCSLYLWDTLWISKSHIPTFIFTPFLQFLNKRFPTIEFIKKFNIKIQYHNFLFTISDLIRDLLITHYAWNFVALSDWLERTLQWGMHHKDCNWGWRKLCGSVKEWWLLKVLSYYLENDLKSAEKNIFLYSMLGTYLLAP